MRTGIRVLQLHARPTLRIQAALQCVKQADYSSMKIYTKTGDGGSSSLYNGERRSKDDFTFAALGDVDELNSMLGVAREYCVDTGLTEQLQHTQSRLLDLGSAIATPIPGSSTSKLERTAFSEEHTQQLEQWIDKLSEQLPPLKNFILPSGGLAAAHLHLARTICRRAERSAVPLRRQEVVDAAVASYLNRLSDYLFTAARYAAMRENKPETVYQKAK